MLSWWYGPTDGGRVQDEHQVQEPPETPAPVFAARALKSAFFGTPAPPIEDTTLEIKTGRGSSTDKDTRNLQCHNTSPTKPPGILLTPGTATTRRKTVSFGTEVSDKKEQNAEGEAGAKSRQSVLEQKGQWSSKEYRRTPLTKSLELARETKPGIFFFERGSSRKEPLMDLGRETSDSEEVAATRTCTKSSTTKSSNQDLLREMISGDEIDGDMTMDLNEPHSESGKYWKTEYEQYHDEAKSEMQKLLKYKQLAKSYAKKKDAEMLALTEKLKEEQRRVISLEDQISRQTTITGHDGNNGQSPGLIKELAKQSALALEYKAQVEKMRAAQASQAITRGPRRTEQPLTDIRPDLRTAQEQSKDLATIRQEMRDLRQVLSAAQQNGSKLHEENTRLMQELLHANLRLEEQEDKLERRRQATQEQLQKKTEALKILQQDYTELKVKAKTQRGNAEHLLKKKHDEAQGLRKELASIKCAVLTAKESQQQQQQKSFENGESVTYQGKQKPDVVSNLLEKRTDSVETNLKRKKSDTEIKSRYPANTSNSRDSRNRILGPSISDASKSPMYRRQANVESEGQSSPVQASCNALSEITNNADTERVSSKGSTSIERTPASRRISNVSRETPNIELPSPEPFLPHIISHVTQDRRSKASPRPSMFMFGSSPPKLDTGRPDATHKPTRQRSDGRLDGERDVHMASTRLSSLSGSRVRTVLPPERAAAARARLEKKNAEKKAKTLGMQIEDTRN